MILGDSVRSAFAPYVDGPLGQAGVRVVPATADNWDTRTALGRLDDWLALADRFEVIHFNFGLHDIRRYGNSTFVPLEEYTANLRQIARRFRDTGARVIFATTTPVVPPANYGRRPEDVIAYNAAARLVMDELGIAVDDLWEIGQANLAHMFPDGTHFRGPVCHAMGLQVLCYITRALEDDPQAARSGGQQDLRVGCRFQEITFPQLPDRTYGDPPFRLDAAASSRLPVALEVVSGPGVLSDGTLALIGTGTVTIRASQPGDVDYAAAKAVEQAFQVAPPAIPIPGVAELAFQQDPGEFGLVALEAEHYAGYRGNGNQAWRVAKRSGSSGGQAMEAVPNRGEAFNEGFVAASPRLDLLVNFVRTGRHYVWVRGWAASAGDDSLHVGLDEAAQETSDRVGWFSLGQWSWSGVTMDGGSRAWLEVPATGLHTLSLWMREDGFVFDRLVLTTAPGYAPTALGPPESPARQLPLPFQQDAGVSGLVSVEAEHYVRLVGQVRHAWRAVAPAGSSGGRAMEAAPNRGDAATAAFDETSPRLDLRVNFVKTGRHFVWVRAWAASAGDDSVHVGLNGSPQASADRISGFALQRWSWSGATMDAGAGAWLDVPWPGVHTVSLWMREDGVVLDKLVLATDSSFVPVDAGPPESPTAPAAAYGAGGLATVGDSAGTTKSLAAALTAVLNRTPLQIEYLSRKEGRSQLSGSGGPGGQYRLEASEDLLTWTTVARGFSASGRREWSIPDSGTLTQRFFRLVSERETASEPTTPEQPGAH